MLNKLQSFIRQYGMVAPGDHVICALSGGADSVALLFGLYLLREKMQFRLSATHFNHHLRGEESDEDEAFVRDFCQCYDIPLFCGGIRVQSGEKGLEAAAREARYAFFATLPGKIATAHTADDNAETVLMHLVRGTGLKGLGAIAPIRGNLIRPMLTVTRQEVVAFLEEWSLPHREDSSNKSDDFLRNRLRHHVMPLLARENPRLAQNLSAMALRLREDEDALSAMIPQGETLSVSFLRQCPPALRKRALERFLKQCGVREPEAAHIEQAEGLVFSDRPSAQARFPGGVTISRNYDTLGPLEAPSPLEPRELPCPGSLFLPESGLRITAESCDAPLLTTDSFTVSPVGTILLRNRQSGDTIRLHGGTKSLKKLFSDRKIPAFRRDLIPVLADEKGVLAVYGFGANLDRAGPGVRITFSKEPQHDADK